MKLIVIMLLLLSPGLSSAFDAAGKSRSIGKLQADNSLQLEQQLRQKNLDSSTLRIDPSLQSRHEYHLPGDDAVEFAIFDAWIDLIDDFDDDGFYHSIRVGFDADTSSELETVYAKLYLSYEGGPWYQYTTTDLFDIYHNEAEDSYQVMTELIEGYLPGYYEVLIDLYSLNHPGIVASRIIDSDDSGFALRLEDQDHDYSEWYEESYTVETYGYGGSFSLPMILLLGGLLAVSPWLRKAVGQRKG